MLERPLAARAAARQRSVDAGLHEPTCSIIQFNTCVCECCLPDHLTMPLHPAASLNAALLMYAKFCIRVQSNDRRRAQRSTGYTCRNSCLHLLAR